MTTQSPGSGKSGEESVGNLLDQLSSVRADLAWAKFLKLHSAVIMQASRRFASGAGSASDCFLFVCEGLSDNGFRRLKSFRPGGPAQFSTWLKAVVVNLCIDWRRKRHGRVRPFAAVSGLPPLDQAVYRHIFVRGLSRGECQRELATQFPGVTLEQVAEANARLFNLLSSRQRWQLGHRSRGSVSLEDSTGLDHEVPDFQPEYPGPGPEQLAGEWVSRDAINEALLKLAPRQRLLLRLRYVEDLTLEEVARLVGLPDPYRTHREIQAAVEELGRHLPQERL